MNTFSRVPPGFRFHPTDEELVDYYLRKKVSSSRIDLDVIKDVDLYKIEPWDLQELCRIITEEQNEWYFFSHKDKKYPTGTRTNRATTAGFWKATGRDKSIYSKHNLIGMRKTLVFYKGRAPNGQKSDWIMHEYRLETDENGAPQEEGWVVCRVFKKKIPTVQKMSEHGSPCWYDDQSTGFMPDHDSPINQNIISYPTNSANHHQLSYACKKEQHDHLQYQLPQEHFMQLPLLQNPKLLIGPFGLEMNQSTTLQSSSSYTIFGSNNSSNSNNNQQEVADPVTDWRVLDKFVASQLSQDQEEDVPNISTNGSPHARQLGKQDMMSDDATLPTSTSFPMELWK